MSQMGRHLPVTQHKAVLPPHSSPDWRSDDCKHLCEDSRAPARQRIASCPRLCPDRLQAPNESLQRRRRHLSAERPSPEAPKHLVTVIYSTPEAAATRRKAIRCAAARPTMKSR